jgi:hypothetical protein
LDLEEVLADSEVCVLNNFSGGVGDVVWKVSLEILSEFSNFDLELSKSILDVGCLFVLEWKNLLLDWSKSFFRNVNKSCLAVLKFY